MKILVTGGAGYIGSHTSRQLLDAGYSVLVMDDLSTGRRASIDPRTQWIEGDVGNAALVRQALEDHEIESVIHFAGSIRVDESVVDPLKYFKNNTVASQTLIAECARAKKVRSFVFSSTAAVYGHPQSVLIPESAPVQPLNPYGASKLMTEWMLRSVTESIQGSHFKGLSLRYFNVAGASFDGRLGQSGEVATHLIRVACQAALGLRPRVEIYGTDYPTPDGTGIRDYIHVEDLARAHLDALNYLDRGGNPGIFNCGYGEGFSVRQVIRTVQEVSGVSFPVREAPRRPGDSAQLIADNRKIRDLLGWEPRYADLKLICESALNWEKRLREEKKA